MHSYEATTRGEEIVQASGLDDLAARISGSDDFHPLIFDLTRQDYSFNPVRPEDQRRLENESISEAADYTKSHYELRTLVRGLEIEPGRQNWRYLGQYADQTLFPHREAVVFQDSVDEDQLVVSGVVGVMLKRYKSRYPILARSRFAEFGFSNHLEACAFVGAYIVGRIMDDETKEMTDDEPNFEMNGRNIDTRITIGGIMHGDFRMGLTRVIKDEVISPTGAVVDFSPKETTCVGGYHSVEPDIVASMITDEYSSSGRAAALRLVNNFTKRLHHLASEGSIPLRAGAFADYGDGDTRHNLMQLQRLLNSPKTKPQLIGEGKLYSAPYLPQSPSLFEIKPHNDGLRFQGRDKDHAEPETGIDIPRQHYCDLFQALVEQAQQGLGRTSPSQHVEILDHAKKILNT